MTMTQIISGSDKLLSQMEQIRPFFRQFGIELIIISSAMVLSIVCIVLSVCLLRLHYHKLISLEYLGWEYWSPPCGTLPSLLFRGFSTHSKPPRTALPDTYLC